MRDDMQTALLLKDKVIEPLRNVELELSKRLQLKLGKNNLRLSDKGEAPAAYRKLVDEYYKRLSSRSKCFFLYHTRRLSVPQSRRGGSRE